MDPLKLKKLNGFSSLPGITSSPEQVNGIADGHENRTRDLSIAVSPTSEVKAVNGHCNSLKPDQKKNVKEREQRKRKLSSVAGVSKSAPNHVEVSKISEPPKKRKKRTIKQSKELNSSVELETVAAKIDIPIKLNLSDKMDLNTDLHKKCNGLCSNPSGTPPRVNGDISAFGANMEVSPNTALKLKIRKITPKQNQAEGKRKRGRPRKPQFVIVSESEKDDVNHSELPNNESKQIPDSAMELAMLPNEASLEEISKKKKRIRKPTSKVLSAKEVKKPRSKVLSAKEVTTPTSKALSAKNAAVLPKKSASALKESKKVESKSEEVELKSKQVEPKRKKLKKEPNGTVTKETNGAAEIEGAEKESNVSVEIESSVASDDTGSIKNGAGSKKDKEAVCIVCEQQENLTFCEGICGNAFHLDCIGLSVVPQGKFVCDECVTGNHCCFVCRQAGNVRQCSQPLCTKHYHDECLRTFKTAKFDGDRFYCPLHFCSTCVSNKTTVVSRGRMIRCVRCPVAYHISGCLVAGCIPVSSTLMVCAKHFLREKNKAHHTHVNVNWCFVCSIGGTLICCESCPAAFHPECISYEGIPEGHFFCKDCTEGKQLLYGDIVWVKLGMYR